ncbi:hypothetical protein NPIL_58511 [Nephila pilipes]|uniref:Uncharacterized protein n=1 Tax=Nephila pilipes TaxID=299642 RepID=A0A8X6U314_NEPPI|nr:hypothetical protein NPIL_58511 [Nephila pilipes]
MTAAVDERMKADPLHLCVEYCGRYKTPSLSSASIILLRLRDDLIGPVNGFEKQSSHTPYYPSFYPELWPSGQVLIRQPLCTGIAVTPSEVLKAQSSILNENRSSQNQ